EEEARRLAAEKKREAEERAKEEAAAAAAAAAAKAKAEAEAKAKALDATPPEAPPQAAPAGPTDDDKKRAIQHWNEGIKAFQRNEPSKARDEWLLCKKFDPTNTDCAEGLKRLENMYGGGM
ncbi:MAG: hypothetical protein KGL53_13055, partial [Elusimicrobia bacterium]|nr:hypothetical protein [Elusimicrobiota bacterium]